MNSFLNGAISVAAAIVALQYLKAWRKTKDSIFRLFAVAFFLLMIERWIIQAVGVETNMPLIYCVRLLAYLAIAGGVVWKNIQTS
jgi:hypothetical protein